ncbi:MAG: hypothetical protein HYV07_28545 [Deltaproteobacteria bacterium]|nr:hypothetical protein [Deltaproteobacteria bacterium]
MSSSVGIRKALATALTNDKAGSVSKSDAEKISKAGIGEIFESKDPAATFTRAKKVVDAAKLLASSRGGATSTLNRFDARGQGAVTARIEQLTGEKQLPEKISSAFKQTMVDTGLAPSKAAVSITNTKKTSSNYQFDFEIGGKTGRAYAIKYADGYVMSPLKLTKSTLDAATHAMRNAFDEEFQDMTAELSASERAAMRRAIVPERALFPGEESDPYNYSDEYPLVLSMANPTGSDHGFYVGIDPKKPSGASAYTFN